MMIKGSLQRFIESVLDAKRICEQDVRILQRDILKDGIAIREEADVLIALDRAIPIAAPAWAEYLVGAVVEFAVWTSRPTGIVDLEKASWLAASLGCGAGPTETAVRIAVEVSKEAERTHEILIAFALHGLRRRQPRMETADPSVLARFAI